MRVTDKSEQSEQMKKTIISNIRSETHQYPTLGRQKYQRIGKRICSRTTWTTFFFTSFWPANDRWSTSYTTAGRHSNSLVNKSERTILTGQHIGRLRSPQHGGDKVFRCYLKTLLYQNKMKLTKLNKLIPSSGFARFDNKYAPSLLNIHQLVIYLFTWPYI